MSARPPRLARALLALAVPAAHREFVLGDVIEAFERRAARGGLPAARRWFWRETIAALAARWPERGVTARDTSRGDSHVHLLLQDVRFGFRLLRRSPGFATVAILTLGLGIGANTTVFSWINSVVLNPIAF